MKVHLASIKVIDLTMKFDKVCEGSTNKHKRVLRQEHRKKCVYSIRPYEIGTFNKIIKLYIIFLIVTRLFSNQKTIHVFFFSSKGY